VNVVVTGDSFLDVDVDGHARRLAPDAPVPVVSEIEMGDRPGGAALAALFAAGGGADVTLVTALGDDGAGRRVAELLRRSGVTVHDVGGTGETARKIRVRADGHCITRVDVDRRPVAIRREAIAATRVLFDAGDAVLVADYGRGVAANTELRKLLRRANALPVVWDPHPLGPEPIEGARLVTPNQREALVRLGRGDAAAEPFPGPAIEAARALRLRWGAMSVAVTCGERGAVLAGGGGPIIVPAEHSAIGDTCGAGDCFAASATLALARGALPSEAVVAAVAAAGDYVASGAASSVSRTMPGQTSRPETLVATSGCFDLLHAGHVSSLRAARALGDRLVVCLNSDASVRRLKGPGRPLVCAADRAEVLRGLACVDDVVVFDEDTPVRVLEGLRPAVFVKGGDYDVTTIPETALLERWGGRTVVVPYRDGHSTTRILQEVRNHVTT
jgi:rfaE bifunctional protein nucleotidyltransferase chain/domain/rfaE bifunctional protein kinase chain/domain